jgi:hypothetical protein
MLDRNIKEKNTRTVTLYLFVNPKHCLCFENFTMSAISNVGWNFDVEIFTHRIIVLQVSLLTNFWILVANVQVYSSSRWQKILLFS